MQNLPIVIGILFFVLGCGCGQGLDKKGVSKEPSAPRSTVPAIVVDADKLISDYKQNELAADGKYKDKLIEVSGKVSNVAETFGMLTADLKFSDDSKYEFISVKCTFPESQKSRLAQVNTGSFSRFVGTGDGMTGGLYVGLRDCTVK